MLILIYIYIFIIIIIFENRLILDIKFEVEFHQTEQPIASIVR